MNYLLSIILLIIFFATLNKKTRKLSVILGLTLILILLTIYPKDSLEAAKNGINLWLFVVFPSLIPFFIINDILLSLKVPESIARLFSPVAKYVFGTSGYGIYAFIMSIFSGYPSGAKITSDLIRDNKISAREGQRVLTFSSTSGPLFIIGAVGVGMFKSAWIGYILFISHITGAILNGIFFKLFFKSGKPSSEGEFINENNRKKSTLAEMLSQAIINSLYVSGLIGGYIILFSVIITLLDKIHFFITFSYIMTHILFIPGEISMIISSIIKTSLEISNGCSILSLMNIGTGYKIILSSFIIAFSGISIIGQVLGVIKNSGINSKKYIIGKIGHGVFSASVCFILIKLSPGVKLVSNTSLQTTSPGIVIILELLLITMLILNLIYRIKNLKRLF